MPKKNLNLDLKTVAYLHMLLGAWACLAALIVFLSSINPVPANPVPSQITEIGVTIRGYWQVGIYTIILGVFTFTMGLFALKQIRIAWTMLFILQIRGFIITWFIYTHGNNQNSIYSALVWSTLFIVFSVILIIRRKQILYPDKQKSGESI